MSSPATPLKPNILIAPLDWGLGHATRCIPLIHSLIRKNCEVWIAADGAVEKLLRQEFPRFRFLPLKGYDIHYSKNSWSLPFTIGKQIPKILSAIQHENDFLEEIVKEHPIHGIISDNRYGLYHETIPSVFMSHQLLIKTPFGKIADKYLQKLNYEYINCFSECWVPDNEAAINLAGELSHPEILPSIPVKYLGPLSRFEKENESGKHLLLLLSGPEPQRSIFENMLIGQLESYKSPVVLVRGLPAETEALQLPSNVSVYNHLPAAELNRKINEASIIISRCGYSTVMDLAILKKKSILVPTPGQTEQEYLSKHLMKNNFALCIDQQKFKLKNALDLSEDFDYRVENFSLENSLETVTDQFLERVNSL